MARRSSKSFWKSALISLLVAIGAWAIFRLTFLLMEGVFEFLGITSEVGILIAILFAIVLILTFVGGKNIKQSIRTLFSR